MGTRGQGGDLDDDRFFRAVAAVAILREHYRRYLSLIEAQEAATRPEDFGRLLALADQVDGVLAELDRAATVSTELARVFPTLLGPGPRVTAIRDMVTRLGAESALIQAQVAAMAPGGPPAGL